MLGDLFISTVTFGELQCTLAFPVSDDVLESTATAAEFLDSIALLMVRESLIKSGLTWETANLILDI
jgi:hypothetical protein